MLFSIIKLSALSARFLFCSFFAKQKVMHLHTSPHLTLQMSIFHALLKYFIVFLSLMFVWSVHAFLSPSLHFLIIDLVSSALLGYPAVCSLSMAQWESAQAAPVLLTLFGTHGCPSTSRICRESDKTLNLLIKCSSCFLLLYLGLI